MKSGDNYKIDGVDGNVGQINAETNLDTDYGFGITQSGNHHLFSFKDNVFTVGFYWYDELSFNLTDLGYQQGEWRIKNKYSSEVMPQDVIVGGNKGVFSYYVYYHVGLGMVCRPNTSLSSTVSNSKINDGSTLIPASVDQFKKMYHFYDGTLPGSVKGGYPMWLNINSNNPFGGSISQFTERTIGSLMLDYVPMSLYIFGQFNEFTSAQKVIESYDSVYSSWVLRTFIDTSTGVMYYNIPTFDYTGRSTSSYNSTTIPWRADEWRGYAKRQRSTTPIETYLGTTFGGLYYGMGRISPGESYLTLIDNYNQITNTRYDSCSVEEIYDNYMSTYFFSHPHTKPTNAKYIIIHRAACEAGLDKNYSGLMGGWCCSSYNWNSQYHKEMFSWPGNFKPFKINDDVKYQ